MIKSTKKSIYGDIPANWKLLTGEELSIKITKGSSPRWQGFKYQSKGVLFVTSENVREGKLDLKIKKFLPKEFGEKSKNSQLKNGDILIVIVGASIGRVCTYKSPDKFTTANINQAVSIFRVKKEYNGKYLAYFIQSPLAQTLLLNQKNDSARPNLSLEDLRNFPFLLPSNTEQINIIRIFSTWDQAINSIETLLFQKEFLKKGLVQQLLAGNRRFPDFNKNWSILPINKIFKRITRTSGDDMTPDVLSITAKVGFVNQKDKFSKVIAGKNLEKYTLLKKGEFSYNKGNSKSYPQGCIYRLKEYELGVVPNVYYSFCANSKKVYEPFYEHYFSSGALNHQLSRLINTGVRNDGLLNFRADDFFSVKVPVPPIEEQKKIAMLFDNINKEIELLSKELTAFKEQKKGLMQQLLTGKKRVKVKDVA